MLLLDKFLHFWFILLDCPMFQKLQEKFYNKNTNST